jgi:hypothetical protein
VRAVPCVCPGRGKRLEYPGSTVEYPWSAAGVPGVPRRAVRRPGARSAHAPPSAVASWPRLPRPAKTERDSKTAKPGERPTGVVWRWRNSKNEWNRAVRDASATEGRGVRATCGLCTETCARSAACGRAARATATSNRPVHLRVSAWPCCALRQLLACAARPPGTACGVHLGGNGLRERLRG